ncbi:putative signal transducing protein [Anaerocolumna sp. MB42-C2]|uniref:putative signal transducing protein n=1 Tax=Anaerocolumna sp. MB42-C2 TaxID=3070997 RepID=UPI0027E07B51|nr:DUF2007 domain-containing protein [Anaerocolumna sp. MB42-C2]WMJ85590.1 DUF2007 domain-containing protein [Anaerocolumna sp. MB42-C2]
MFCPKCKCEYREGFKICPDCNENLVDSLPLPEKNIEILTALNPIKIKSVANDIDAELLINLLQNNNIPCFKKSKGAGGYMNIYMGYSIFGEDIYVDKEDYTRAMDILSELDLCPDNMSTSTEENVPMDYSIPFYRNPRMIARIILIAVAGTSIFFTILSKI